MTTSAEIAVERRGPVLVARLSGEVESLLRAAVNRQGLSARAYHRVLKIARTIAEIKGSSIVIHTGSLEEAEIEGPFEWVSVLNVLHHVRDPLASGLRRVGTSTIGVVVPHLTDTVMAMFYEEIAHACRRSGLFAIVATSDDEPDGDHAAVEALLHRQVSTFLAFVADEPNVYRFLVRHAPVPPGSGSQRNQFSLLVAGGTADFLAASGWERTRALVAADLLVGGLEAVADRWLGEPVAPHPELAEMVTTLVWDGFLAASEATGARAPHP